MSPDASEAPFAPQRYRIAPAGACTPGCKWIRRVVQALGPIWLKRPHVARFGCAGCGAFFDWGRFQCMLGSRPLVTCAFPHGPGVDPPEGSLTPEDDARALALHSRLAGGPFSVQCTTCGKQHVMLQFGLGQHSWASPAHLVFWMRQDMSPL